MSAGLLHTMVSDCCVTVRLASPATEEYVPSPAKVALMNSGCGPASIPARLTFGSEATPEASVTADPTTALLRENVIVFPRTVPRLDESVALRLTVPPNTPAASATARPAPSVFTVNCRRGLADAPQSGVGAVSPAKLAWTS